MEKHKYSKYFTRYLSGVKTSKDEANAEFLFFVTNNLRKGAATNAVQIAEWVGGKMM